MGDIIKAIEFLGIPATIAITLVGLFLVLQIIGEFCELKGKIVPEFLKIRKYFKRKKQEKEDTKRMIQDCKQALLEFNYHYSPANIAKRNNWMHEVDDSVRSNDELIQKLDGKMDKLLETNEALTTQLEQVKSNVLENEADRLRSELFDCGNRCRRHIRLHPEEMDHIRDVFQKYSEVLHKNGPGEKEFNFITDYYNKQDFPDYHQKNNDKK
jgi:Mg2+ and Co2+ transporter CorA